MVVFLIKWKCDPYGKLHFGQSSKGTRHKVRYSNLISFSLCQVWQMPNQSSNAGITSQHRKLTVYSTHLAAEVTTSNVTKMSSSKLNIWSL